MTAIDTPTARTYTWEALALADVHPQRARILMLMDANRDKEWSAKSLSEELGLTLGGTAYHVRTLHRQRYLLVSGHGRVRGAHQTFYRLDGRRRPR